MIIHIYSKYNSAEELITEYYKKLRAIDDYNAKELPLSKFDSTNPGIFNHSLYKLENKLIIRSKINSNLGA